MSRPPIVALAGLLAFLVAVAGACSPLTPTQAPVATPQPSSTPGATSSPAATPAPTVEPGTEAYLRNVAAAFEITDPGVPGNGTAFRIPTPPVMPNGEHAVRITFEIVGCPVDSDGSVWMDLPDRGGVTVGHCRDNEPIPSGRGQAVWQHDTYQPLAAGGEIVLRAGFAEGAGPVRLVPVYTSVDAQSPTTRTDLGVWAMTPQPGKLRLYPAGQDLLERSVYEDVTLPDGSVATTWSVVLRSCDNPGPRLIRFLVSVGGYEAEEIGTCPAHSGGITMTEIEQFAPPEGTEVTITVAGSNSKAAWVIGEDYWR